jgi:hypothetical protein
MPLSLKILLLMIADGRGIMTESFAITSLTEE